MVNYILATMEYRFLSLIWENEPLSSMDLVRKCDETFNWKKSTTFTMIRKMKDKGLIKNYNSVVFSCVPRKEIIRMESSLFIDQMCSGSLSLFLSYYLYNKTLSNEEAETLIQLIDSYRS